MRTRPLCFFCKHFHISKWDADEKTCNVFPKGIPISIWDNKFNHQQPFIGDKGIQFEVYPDLYNLPEEVLKNDGELSREELAREYEERVIKIANYINRNVSSSPFYQIRQKSHLYLYQLLNITRRLR